jgi:hypothetical protein
MSTDQPTMLPAWLAREFVDMRAGVNDDQALKKLVQAALGYVFSTTVTTAAGQLSGEVTAADIVRKIMDSHHEYGKHLGSAVSVDLEKGERAEAFEWLRGVGDQVDTERVTIVDGRVVIAGLARRVPPLAEQLSANGFLHALETELEEQYGIPADRIFLPPEAVPTHTDNPARIDELNRQSLAKVVATRIRYVHAEEVATGDPDSRGGAFLVHLYGPWGSGKTSLLNFLQEELVSPPTTADEPRPERWVVVVFNAWRHQRLAPPWWWLMRMLYLDGLRQLWKIDRPKALWLFLREQWWRWWRALLWLLVLWGFVLAAWQLDLVGVLTRQNWSFAKLGAYVAATAALLASVATVWSVVRGAARWLFATSARGARAYIDNARDPMNTVKGHFTELIRWIHHPVAIFIDDLDRCRGDYIIQLLEGIQTTFRDEPVTFVVAADRDWLADSFAAEYSTFTSTGTEPARPLGYLFLEKTFQLSVGVPGLSPAVRGLFWDRLISSGKAAANRSDLDHARQQARELFKDATSEAEVLSRLNRAPGDTPEQLVARAEAAAVVLSTPGVEREHERALKPFAQLLDPNPRAMKRLVNAYSMARSVEVLSRRNLSTNRVAQQRRALWTILNLRWPLLGTWFSEHPDHIELVGNEHLPQTIPRELQSLFTDPEVVSVVRGQADGVEIKLDTAGVKDCLL